MKRKPLLYADLFKAPRNNMAPVEEQENIICMPENGPGSSSLGASCSSGFSTPFGSELGSSGTSVSDDEDFMAELSRQMAECMLNEEEEEDHAEINDTAGGCACEGFEVSQIKNQPRESSIGERRVKGNKRVNETGRTYMNYRRNGQGIGGSAMKAIFLDNSGSSYGLGGTGVFLPRFPNDPTPEKKPGCSTVLMPMRVLQTLELHFSRINSGSSSPITSGTGSHGIGHGTSRTHWGLKDSKNGLSQQNNDQRFQNRPENEEEEMQLPQEWTY